MQKPAWIITYDYVANRELLIQGPRNADTIDVIQTLQNGIDFRIFDDHDTLYFSGKLNETCLDPEYRGDDPLHGFAIPNTKGRQLFIKRPNEQTWTDVTT